MESITAEPTILQNLLVLLQTLLTLLLQVTSLGFQWFFCILAAAVCLFAINWKKARHMLAVGGWAPAVLMIFLIALVWSRIAPSSCASCGMPNFWWQLGFVSLLAGAAMFLGWVQSVMHWTPHDITFDPPAHVHGHGHDHGHGQSHH